MSSKTELLVGHFDDKWIDLVKRIAIAWCPEGRYGAGTEADRSHTQRAVSPRRLNGHADPRAGTVVGGWLIPKIGPEELETMLRRAIHQQTVPEIDFSLFGRPPLSGSNVLGLIAHAQDAIEIPDH